MAQTPEYIIIQALQYFYVKAEGQFECDRECVICSDGFEGTQVVKLPCDDKHVYHTACIEQWLVRNPVCPICRANVCPKRVARSEGSLMIVLNAADVRRGDDAEDSGEQSYSYGSYGSDEDSYYGSDSDPSVISESS